jgi:hypothetical protein
MRRVSAAVMVLIACLAIGSVSVATAKKKGRVGARISLAVSATPPSPYSQGGGTYSGHIKTSKRCRKGRRVTIKHNGSPIGNSTSSRKGNYSFFSPVVPALGTYVAKAHKKVFNNKKKHKKVVCGAAKSNTVTVP